MRVLNVLPWSPLVRFGGYETFVKETGRQLVKQGHSVFVLGHATSKKGLQEVDQDGIRYFHIGGWKAQNYVSPRISFRNFLETLRYVIGTTPFLIKLLAAYRIDSVIVYREPFQAPFAITARIFGSKAWLAHVVVRKSRSSTSFVFMTNRALLRCYSGLFTYVRYFRAEGQSIDNITELRKHIPNKVFYLPGGINVGTIDELTPKLWMKRLKASSDHVVVCPRRLTAQKGVHILVESIPMVVKELHGKKPLFVLAHDGELRKQLKVRSEILGIDQYLLFSPEPLIGTLMCELIKCSDLVVVPSLSEEDFGMAFLESWAAKVPVVTTNVGGIPSLVSHGVNGLIVPPGDARSLARAIVFLLASPELRETLAESGFKTVESFYSIERVASELAVILGHS